MEFYCFTSELAAALEGLYKSPHGLLVKALRVEALPDQPKMPGAAAPQPVPVAPPVPGAPGQRPGRRPPGSGVAPPKEGLETVLNEKPLRATLLIEVVKPGGTK